MEDVEHDLPHSLVAERWVGKWRTYEAGQHGQRFKTVEVYFMRCQITCPPLGELCNSVA